MKFSYAIDPERRMIFVRYEGHFTLARLLVCSRRLWDDPAYSRSYSGFVDLSDNSLSVSIGDLRSLFQIMSTRPEIGEGRWAAVASSPLTTACGLLYQTAISERHTFEVFSSYEAAADYLRLEGALPPLREVPVE